jgi:hypothetical protein
MKSTLHSGRKSDASLQDILIPPSSLQSHILSSLCGINVHLTMHITFITALNLKKVKGKREGSSSFIGRSLGNIHHARRTKERGRQKKETLWLGVEPRLPAIRQMFSIKLTSKCTNRYTTKDW